MATWKEKYNKKYGYEKDKSHTLSAISKKTGVSKAGLQKIYNKGIGAWKTNIGSVRLKKDFSKNPNTSKYPRKSRLGKEQWAMARVYSAVMGGKASKVDKKELRMEMGGKTQKINWSEYYKQGGLTESIMSDEMKERLFDENGERKIDLDSIKVLTDYVNSLPQTKSMYFNESTQTYTPKRQKLHREIIEEFKDDLVCIQSDEPIAILMGGSPASGKSTFLRKYAPYLLSEELLRIDADEVRSKLPEYEGWNASQTHLETKDIVNTLLSDRTIGLPCEFDLIYDGTMNNTKSYLPLIKLLKKLNYKIFVVYIDNVPKDVIVKRALERYKKSGRFVPLEVIDDFFEKGKSALNEIKKQVDGYMVVDGSDNNYTILEQGGIRLPQNRVYSKIGYPVDESVFDRQGFYKGYFERLSPSKMDVSSTSDGKVIINLNEKLRQGGAVETDVETDAILGEFYAKGGETDFNPDGKIKDKIVHASGEAGGMLVGKRHSKGGIKAINKSTGQPLEMEGGEVVITRDAVSDPKKRSFNGKMMTNRQILSAINESGGGVSFADGGEVPADVCFDCNAEYEYGGKTMCGKDLAYAMGGVTTAIVTDPNQAMEDLQATYGFGDVYADGGEVDEIFKGVFEEGGETKIEVYEPSKDSTVIFLESKIKELRNNFDKKRAITSNLQKGLMLREIRKYETLLYNHKTKKRPKGKLLKDFVKGSKLRFGNMDAQRTPASTKTDLTKEESKLVRTESFIDWFGDWELAKETGNYTGVSKVIDEKTKEPLVVYHGTDTLFTSWETYTSNNLHYFAKKRKFAEFFATSWQFRTDQTAKDSAIIKNQNPFKGTYIYPCFLQIKNPIDLSVFGVDKKPIKTYLDYLKVKYDINNFDWVANNVTTYTDFKTPVYSWMIIRMWQSFNLYIKNNTPFDGFIFYEYIPDSDKNGLKDASLCYTTFNSEQIKFANASTFNKNKDSRFYYGGEI